MLFGRSNFHPEFIFSSGLSHITRSSLENLIKRQTVADLSCVFCSERETCSHLLFTYTVATAVWKETSRITGTDVFPACFEKIVGLWLCENKHEVTNVFHAAVMWVL